MTSLKWAKWGEPWSPFYRWETRGLENKLKTPQIMQYAAKVRTEVLWPGAHWWILCGLAVHKWTSGMQSCGPGSANQTCLREGFTMELVPKGPAHVVNAVPRCWFFQGLSGSWGCPDPPSSEQSVTKASPRCDCSLLLSFGACILTLPWIWENLVSFNK